MSNANGWKKSQGRRHDRWKEQQHDQATATKEEQPLLPTGRKGMWGRVIILICLVVGAAGFCRQELLRTRTGTRCY
jgi:hypothetical protein